MFISTLYFLLGKGDKDTGIVLGALDIIALVALSFMAGRWFNWAGVILSITFLILAMRGARAYFVWREKRRQRLMKNPGWNGFGDTWVPLADMWADVFSGAGVFFMIVLILGKLSLFLW